MLFPMAWTRNGVDEEMILAFARSILGYLAYPIWSSQVAMA
jgi:hypothetical protein